MLEVNGELYMFDDSIKFKYKWRSYQQRILDEASGYLKDKKINIVASPGSGKTIIGLELARMLNEPLLILSPTTTIKNQWILRFVSSFMPDNSKTPSWISDNIYNLKFFNSVTYQGLHCAYKRIVQKESILDTDDSVEQEKTNTNLNEIKSYDLIKEINKKKIKTIILDESHHLKKEWWQSLTKVLESIDDVIIISLTATPPYDISYGEWKKYIKLCGEVDAEIQVPELVQKNCLCPHQDYVYFSHPTKDEIDKIGEYEREVKYFLDNLKNNRNFIEQILNYKYIINTNLYIEEILENPEVYSSMLIFLHEVNINITKEKIKILGHQSKIPKLDAGWLEILLQYVLFENKKEFESDVTKDIENQLNKLGAIEKQKVIIRNNQKLKKYFINSMSKLSSITKIVDAEYGNLKSDLRMVILTDYLRKEYLFDNSLSINKIGVFPIFLKLLDKNINMAILTGSLFLIPNFCLEKLFAISKQYDLDKNDIDVILLENVKDYSIVKSSNKNRNNLMNAITKLFKLGDVNIIIGTKALLGEGWDEPSINSLILASFVGSYVLSNQMRGRAIRTSDNKDKTANIWHLVSVASINRDLINNDDYDMIRRRFNSFIGVAYSKNSIESGIERLDIPSSEVEFNIDSYNKKVLDLSRKREAMANKWFSLLDIDDISFKINTQVETKKKKLIRPLAVIDFKRVLFLAILSCFIYFLNIFLSKNQNYNLKELSIIIGISIILAIVVCIPLIIQCVKAILLSVPEAQLKTLVKVVINSLEESDLIEPSIYKINIKKNEDKTKNFISIIGKKEEELTLIYKSLNEIFSHVEKERYILVKDKKFIRSYYNVPYAIATNKKMATIFQKNWNKYIGKVNLVYTNSLEGRAILLKARKNSFDYKREDIFSNRKKVLNKWE